MALMDTASKHLIIHLPACTHSMVNHSMGPSSEQAVEGFHGAEVVAESTVAVEGSVVGSSKKDVAWGPPTESSCPCAFYLRSRPCLPAGRPAYPALGKGWDVK